MSIRLIPSNFLEPWGYETLKDENVLWKKLDNLSKVIITPTIYEVGGI